MVSSADEASVALSCADCKRVKRSTTGRGLYPCIGCTFEWKDKRARERLHARLDEIGWVRIQSHLLSYLGASRVPWLVVRLANHRGGFDDSGIVPRWVDTFLSAGTLVREKYDGDAPAVSVEDTEWRLFSSAPMSGLEAERLGHLDNNPAPEWRKVLDYAAFSPHFRAGVEAVALLSPKSEQGARAIVESVRALGPEDLFERVRR